MRGLAVDRLKAYAEYREVDPIPGYAEIARSVQGRAVADGGPMASQPLWELSAARKPALGPV